jgi:hypothetical protein
VTLIHKAKGYEFYAHYDPTAGVYEVFLDSEGESYIGVCDTLAQARAFVREWLAEKEANR